MEITGRLIRDAEVTTLKDGRKVVNFSIAINDYYKTKDGEEHNLTEYIRCAYWINSGVASLLTKGTLVELFGRISASAWNDSNGDARASLDFHTSNIKILARMQKSKQGEALTPTSGDGDDKPASSADRDDLPF
jgi:single-strand DNA-binding protein